MSDTKIVIYGAEWCGPCHTTKHYLERLGLGYDYHDVDREVEGRMAVLEKSGQLGIPVIDIGGDIIVGFDKPRLDAAIEKHKLIS